MEELLFADGGTTFGWWGKLLLADGELHLANGGTKCWLLISDSDKQPKVVPPTAKSIFGMHFVLKEIIFGENVSWMICFSPYIFFFAQLFPFKPITKISNIYLKLENILSNWSKIALAGKSASRSHLQSRLFNDPCMPQCRNQFSAQITLLSLPMVSGFPKMLNINSKLYPGLVCMRSHPKHIWDLIFHIVYSSEREISQNVKETWLQICAGQNFLPNANINLIFGQGIYKLDVFSIDSPFGHIPDHNNLCHNGHFP